MKMKEDKSIPALRLVSHQLEQAVFERCGDLMAWMGAMQAQDYTMSKWAIGMRLKNGTLQKVNEAIRTGEIVRTHIMRPTWHWVAGKDLHWMLQLSAQRVRRAIDGWTKASGLEIPESLYTRCNNLIGKSLADGQHLTKEEIGEELAKAGIITEVHYMRRYMLRAELEGIVCSGGDKEGKPTYALLEKQVGSASGLLKEEALARLAIRYFCGHSPASLADFVWWSGLTVIEAKQAIRLVEDQLVKETWDGQEYWIHISCQEKKKEAVMHFLPPYDEYLIAYKERSAVLKAQHFSKAFNKWGIFYPVIAYKGQIVGNWKKTEKKNQLQVDASFFEQNPDIRPELLQEAENRYRKFRMNR